MRTFTRNLLALTGLASLTGGIWLLSRLERRLIARSNGREYGPASHLEYYGRIARQLMDAADTEASSMARQAAEADDHAYDRYMDGHRLKPAD